MSRDLRVPSAADLAADAPQEVAEGPLQLGAAGTDLPTVMVEGKDRPSMAHRTIHRYYRRQEPDALARPSESERGAPGDRRSYRNWRVIGLGNGDSLGVVW